MEDLTGKSTDLDGTVTFLVNEDGEMMDITQTLSMMENQQEGSLVIITTSQQLETSGEIVRPLSEEEANGFPFSFKPCDDFLINQSITFQLPEVATDTNYTNSEEIPAHQFSSNGNFQTINCLAPVDGQTLLVLNSPLLTNASVSSGNALGKKKFKKPGNPTILPKPIQEALHPTNSSQSNLRTKRKHCSGKEKEDSEDYEVFVLPQSSTISTPNGKIYVCELCPEEIGQQEYSQFGNLIRHFRQTHRLRLLKQASAQCREPECTYKSWKVDDLRQHLNLIHNFPTEIQKIDFTSMEEFEIWKTKEEERSSSKFIRSSGDHSGKGRTGRVGPVYIYYTCHRSGNPRVRSQTNKIKKKNSRGSLKISGICTASISLLHDRDLNKITCEYCSMHYGHDISRDEQARQNLSKQEKDWILQLLLRGWNSDEIVKTLKSGTIKGTTDRMRKVVRQDVFNVCRSQGVRSFERRDPDDGQSVNLWVQQLQTKLSVLVWNQSCNPFSIIVMNPQQVELAKQHGRILHVADLPLALDRHYRLIVLTTLSLGEAYLIAYALVDQSGPEALQAVFAAVKTKLGPGHLFQPDFILSENPLSVTDAWTTGTYDFPIFVLPPWKVEGEWNEGLVKFINEESKREAVKKCLDTLLTENDPFRFSAFLQLFTGMLAADEEMLSFSTFFASNYAEVATHWPGFHSLPDFSSLQQLNGEIELIVRRSRTVKRLDKCIYSLEYISANQPFHSLTEFINSQNEISVLRQNISSQLTTLSSTVQQCDKLKHLRNLNGLLNKALSNFNL